MEPMPRGKEVLRCKPFAHVVSLAQQEHICDFCMKEAEAGGSNKFKKCSGCKVVYYCKVDCQKKAWGSYHRQECLYLRKVSPKIPTDTVRLMARIIYKLRNGGMREFQTLPDGRQRYFEDLMSHQKEIVRDSERVEAFMSFFEVLKDCLGSDLPPKSEVLDIYGRVIVNSFNIMSNQYQSVGVGLYLAASVIDHSCAPNANAVFEGSTLLLRTIDKVDTFADIRISYTHLLDTTETRKENLKKQYYFDCDCIKCSDANDEAKFALRCTKCKGCVPISTKTCSNCGNEMHDEALEKYNKITEEYKNTVIDNKGGHPEPLTECEAFYPDMKAVFHPHDKMYLDVLEVVYEEKLAKDDFESSLNICLDILEHYRFHYPKFDLNTGLMELKAAKLCAYLNKLSEAEKHLSRGKDILLVTHGQSHHLVAVDLRRIKQDIDMGTREIKDLLTNSALQQKGKWAKSG